jgi:hypothetical protein
MAGGRSGKDDRKQNTLAPLVFWNSADYYRLETKPNLVMSLGWHCDDDIGPEVHRGHHVHHTEGQGCYCHRHLQESLRKLIWILCCKYGIVNFQALRLLKPRSGISRKPISLGDLP